MECPRTVNFCEVVFYGKTRTVMQLHVGISVVEEISPVFGDVYLSITTEFMIEKT